MQVRFLRRDASGQRQFIGIGIKTHPVNFIPHTSVVSIGVLPCVNWCDRLGLTS